MSDFKYQVINGRLLETQHAMIPLNDVGLLRSLAIFDFLRVERNVPIFLDDHVNRAIRSANTLGIELPWDALAIREMCLKLVDANKPGNAGLRIVITGGYSIDGYTPSSPNIYVMLNPMPFYPKEAFVSGGALITAEYQRDSPEVKTTIYIKSFQEAKRMKDAGAVEILYYWGDVVSECSRSNIFIVDEEDRLITPERGMLKGITRQHLMDMARVDHEIIERALLLDEVFSAKEVFITSTAKGVMPIVRVDGKSIADGKVGPVTSKLQKQFRELIDNIVAKGQGALQ